MESPSPKCFVVLSTALALLVTGCRRDHAPDRRSAVLGRTSWPSKWDVRAIANAGRVTIPSEVGDELHSEERIGAVRESDIERTYLLAWYSVKHATGSSDAAIIWYRFKDPQDSLSWRYSHRRYWAIAFAVRVDSLWRIAAAKRPTYPSLDSAAVRVFDYPPPNTYLIRAISELGWGGRISKGVISLPSPSMEGVFSSGIDSLSWYVVTGEQPVVYWDSVSAFEMEAHQQREVLR